MEQYRDLISFIKEAKYAAYASGGGSAEQPSRPGAKDIPYERGPYTYLDSYYGEIHFSGQEVVWEEGKALWSMNYYGYTHDPISGFPEFLNECLREISEDAPYRGPASKRNDIFEYRCTWSGNIERFSGEEEIVHEGKVIFSLSFHGGIVQYC